MGVQPYRLKTAYHSCNSPLVALYYPGLQAMSKEPRNRGSRHGGFWMKHNMAFITLPPLLMEVIFASITADTSLAVVNILPPDRVSLLTLLTTCESESKTDAPWAPPRLDEAERAEFNRPTGDYTYEVAHVVSHSRSPLRTGYSRHFRNTVPIYHYHHQSKWVMGVIITKWSVGQ